MKKNSAFHAVQGKTLNLGKNLRQKVLTRTLQWGYSTNNPVHQNVDSVKAFGGERSLKLSVDRTSTAEFC